MSGQKAARIGLERVGGEYYLVLPNGQRLENARITRVGNNPAIFRHGPVTRIQVVLEIPEVRDRPQGDTKARSGDGNPQAEEAGTSESPKKYKKSDTKDEEAGIDEGN